jgi:hypothetical protein
MPYDVDINNFAFLSYSNVMTLLSVDPKSTGMTPKQSVFPHSVFSTLFIFLRSADRKMS